MDVRPDGIAAWKAVEKSRIVLQYNNPWRGFAGAAAIGIVACIVVFCIWGLGYVLFPAVLTLAGTATSLYYFLGEKRIGALLAEISSEHIAIGCPRDRIIIPWIAVDTSVAQLPINDKYMAIPIAPDRRGDVLFHTAQGKVPWDRSDYRRFILTVRFNPSQSWVEVRTTPNAFFVKILAFVYPMIVILKDRREGKSSP